MARRSRSKSNSKSNVAVYAIVAVAVIAALVVGFIIIGKDDNKNPEFNRSALLEEGGRSMKDDIYKISGKITEKRSLSGDRGFLLTISQDNKIKNSGPIPVHVPPNIAKINLEKSHSYVFTVKVNAEGLPVALDVKAK